MLQARNWTSIVARARRTTGIDYLTLCERHGRQETLLARIDLWTPEGLRTLLPHMDTVDPADDGPAEPQPRPPFWERLDDWDANTDDDAVSAEDPGDDDLPEVSEADRVEAALRYTLEMACDNAVPGETSGFRLRAYAPKGGPLWSRVFYLSTLGMRAAGGAGIDDSLDELGQSIGPPEMASDGRRFDPPDGGDGRLLRLIDLQHDAHVRLLQAFTAGLKEVKNLYGHVLRDQRKVTEDLGHQLSGLQHRHLELVDNVLDARTQQASARKQAQDEDADRALREQVIHGGLQQLSRLAPMVMLKYAIDQGADAETLGMLLQMAELPLPDGEAGPGAPAAAGSAPGSGPSPGAGPTPPPAAQAPGPQRQPAASPLAHLAQLQRYRPLLQHLEADPTLAAALADPDLHAMLEHEAVRERLAQALTSMAQAARAQREAEAQPPPSGDAAVPTPSPTPEPGSVHVPHATS